MLLFGVGICQYSLIVKLQELKCHDFLPFWTNPTNIMQSLLKWQSMEKHEFHEVLPKMIHQVICNDFKWDLEAIVHSLKTEYEC